MESVVQWFNLTFRILLLCSSFYLILDSIVKTKGVSTRRCMCFFFSTLIVTTSAFVVSMYIFKETCCDLCGSPMQGFPSLKSN